MFSLLRRNNRAIGPAVQSVRAKLSLEALEAREVPATLYTQPVSFSAATATLGTSAVVNFDDIDASPVNNTIQGRAQFDGNRYTNRGITFSNPNGHPLYTAPGGLPWNASNSLSVYRFPFDPYFVPGVFTEGDDLTVTLAQPSPAFGLTLVDNDSQRPAKYIQFIDAAGGVIEQTGFPSNYTSFRAFIGVVSLDRPVARVNIVQDAGDGDDIDFDDFTFFAPRPDIVITSAQLQTATTVGFTYQTTGNPGPFAVSVYRSADPNFDSGDPIVATTLVTTPSAPGGSPASIALGTEMPIDPARRYVLVVADPTQGITEANEGNNTSSFRKLALGAVTHGYQPTGQMPGWVTASAAELRLDGYADAIPFDWALRSSLPVPNMATSAGVDLASRVRSLAAQLASQPTDVIDVHFIGHSRGSVVISQALLSLQSNPGPTSLQLGYYTMTMLDPHPARNRGSLIQGLIELANGTGVSTVGGFSFNPASWVSRSLAVATLVFQAQVNDPEVVIAQNVDGAEVYRQQLPWHAQQSLPDRLLGFNLWAAPPSAILNPYSRPIVLVFDVGASGIGHTGVAEWYLNTILR